MLLPKTARWLRVAKKALEREGFHGEALDKEISGRAAFVYLTASALKHGRFVSSLHPSVIDEHRPQSDDDWNWLFGRLSELSRCRWIKKHMQMMKEQNK
jgi:hypothetical protein